MMHSMLDIWVGLRASCGGKCNLDKMHKIPVEWGKEPGKVVSTISARLSVRAFGMGNSRIYIGRGYS